LRWSQTKLHKYADKEWRRLRIWRQRGDIAFVVMIIVID